jgi:hypothetical protein
MAVHRACYATRTDVMSAPDIRLTPDAIRHVDSALEAASEEADRLTNRRFWNATETRKWDWPGFQRAAPWRIWLDAYEPADVTVNPPVVTSGGVTIPDSAILFGPWNGAPPFRFMELDRSQAYAFGGGPTPQQSVHVTGTFGYWLRSRAAGQLGAAVTTTAATTVTASDSSAADVGDVLTVDAEALLVSDSAFAATGQSQQGSGCSTADTADNVLAVTDGTQLHAGEILALDAEQMLALSVTGNNITVERAFAGTVLSTHSAASVLAPRLLTVIRGFGGTTVATHASAAALTAALVPGMIREYAIAEALNYVFQKTSGYARTIGENGASTVPGGSLPDLRARVAERYGRRLRQRVV